MVKKFEIWNSEVNMEEWKDFLAEEIEMNPLLYQSEQDKFIRVYEANQEFFEDERVNLDKVLENPILVIANLGLWNGRIYAYKIIHSKNIKDILYSSMNGQSELRWYCDGYNICCDESHHDGTNHYIYREIKNINNINDFTSMIYNQVKGWQKKINYYTRSIAKDVGQIYGFCA